MSKYKLIIFGAIALLASCATKPRVPANVSFFCGSTSDCNSKWARAIAWASDNAKRGIETQTDNLIQTYGSTNYDTYGSVNYYIYNFANYSKTPGYTINKVLNPDGSGNIIFHATCSAWSECIPGRKLAEQSFASAIGG